MSETEVSHWETGNQKKMQAFSFSVIRFQGNQPHSLIPALISSEDTAQRSNHPCCMPPTKVPPFPSIATLKTIHLWTHSNHQNHTSFNDEILATIMLQAGTKLYTPKCVQRLGFAVQLHSTCTLLTTVPSESTSYFLPHPIHHSKYVSSTAKQLGPIPSKWDPCSPCSDISQ